MPLTTGTRLGPYEIVALLGAGGMGGGCGERAQRVEPPRVRAFSCQFATTNVSALSPPAVSRNGK